MAASLEDALIEFFRRTTVSSAIIRRLANAGEPLLHQELVNNVNAMMVHLLPDYAFAGSAKDVADSLHSFEPTVEKGLELLIGAGIVNESASMCSLSEVGEELHRKLSEETD
jgi:hypothetical protein